MKEGLMEEGEGGRKSLQWNGFGCLSYPFSLSCGPGCLSIQTSPLLGYPLTLTAGRLISSSMASFDRLSFHDSAPPTFYSNAPNDSSSFLNGGLSHLSRNKTEKYRIGTLAQTAQNRARGLAGFEQIDFDRLDDEMSNRKRRRGRRAKVKAWMVNEGMLMLAARHGFKVRLKLT